MGCSRPTGPSMLLASSAMSPRSRRWRTPTMTSAMRSSSSTAVLPARAAFGWRRGAEAISRPFFFDLLVSRCRRSGRLAFTSPA
jgi:hypothetical protein